MTNIRLAARLTNRTAPGAVHGKIRSAAVVLLAGVLTSTVVVSASYAINTPRSRTISVTHGLILRNATIVDTHTGKLAPHMSVVIDDGKIVAIVPAVSVRAARSARSVDLHGKFVVPGYNDMHAHPLTSSDPQGSLALMLANGVTGFREMGGSPEMLASRRDGKLFPGKDVPELLAAPGTVLTMQNAATPDAAVAEVRRQKDEGADFIKMINVPPAAFFAAADEVRRQGLTMVGHLPPLVDVRDASRAGMHSIEHLGPREGIWLGCSSDEAALRLDLQQDLHPPPTSPPGSAPVNVMLIAVANPLLFTGSGEFGRLRRELASYDDTKCRDLARTFVANGTWQVPTLIRLSTMEFGDADRYTKDPNLRYMPPQTRLLWDGVSRKFSTNFSPEQKQVFNDLFAAQLKLVKLFDETDVRMLAGSDFGGGLLVSGFSLHQEFDLLGQAGLSPLTVLQMTTLDAAQFLGREATMGSVAPGSDANLVVLNANPIAGVQNLHKIYGVVRAGTYYDATALGALKQRTENRQKARANGARP